MLEEKSGSKWNRGDMPRGSYDDCPLDRSELGRSSWKLLHTVAAYYPDYPDSVDQRDMYLFMNLFAKFYPCKECGVHFQRYLRNDPPDVRSRGHLSDWLCNLHNAVNRRLQKPDFNCLVTDQRWRSGWSDGSCDWLPDPSVPTSRDRSWLLLSGNVDLLNCGARDLIIAY